jgi:hypothetical protein
MIPDFAQTLHERFAREGVPLLLAGGWAVCHHGYSRLTLDVDWVCPRNREHEAVALMDQLGFDKVTDGRASRFKRRGDPGFPYVDFISVDPVSFGKMAGEDVDRSTSRIPVISFRALLAMKLFALKGNHSRKGKDLLDIRFLLSDGHQQIPDEEFRALCERHAGPGAYKQIKSNS